MFRKEKEIKKQSFILSELVGEATKDDQTALIKMIIMKLDEITYKKEYSEKTDDYKIGDNNY